MDAYIWLEALPPTLSLQRDLLRSLLAAIEANPRRRWLLLSCSLAEERADAFSNLDLGLGVAD